MSDPAERTGTEPDSALAPDPAAEPAATTPEPPAESEPSAVSEAASPTPTEPAPTAASSVPLAEPVPTAEPAPTDESAPTAEPVPTDESAPTAEPVPTAEPAPTAAASVPPEPVSPTPAAVDVSAVQEPPPKLPGPPPPPGAAPVAPRVSDAGKVVSGIVTELSADELTLHLEDGRTAVLARRHWDLHPIDDLNAVISVNDRVDAAVLARDDPNGRVVLSRSWSIKKKAWEAIDAALESHTPVKARVTSLSAKGVVVDVGGLRGFVPASHLALEPLSDLSEFADQVLELRILEADQRKERLVLSRRSLLLREQRKQTHDVLTNLEVGTVITGTVASLADYGAFVDLGGVKGLVHLSELSWQRVGHPRDVVTVGEEVQVKVLDVKVKKRRVSLSIRQIAADPFAGVTVGAVVSGPVTRLVDFGAFVDLGGIEGLVHLSELAEYRVSAPEEIVTPGEDVMVKILAVDKRRRRIELSIRQAVSDQYGQ